MNAYHYIWLAALAGAVVSHATTSQVATVICLVGYFGTLIVESIRNSRSSERIGFHDRMYGSDDGR